MDSSSAFCNFKISWLSCLWLKWLKGQSISVTRWAREWIDFSGNVAHTVHVVPLKHVDEHHAGHVLFKDSMSLTWAYNNNRVPNQGYVSSTIKCFMWQVIWELFRDSEFVSIRHTLQKRNSVVSHDRYVDIQSQCEDSGCLVALLLVPKCWWCWTCQHVRGSPQ